MRKNKKKIYILAAMLTVLTAALMSCKSLPRQEKKTLQIDAVFPSPFDQNGNAIVKLEGDTVTMPLWYWLKITEYVIDVESNKELQELQNNENIRN